MKNCRGTTRLHSQSSTATMPMSSSTSRLKGCKSPWTRTKGPWLRLDQSNPRHTRGRCGGDTNNLRPGLHLEHCPGLGERHCRQFAAACPCRHQQMPGCCRGRSICPGLLKARGLGALVSSGLSTQPSCAPRKSRLQAAANTQSREILIS